MEKEEIARNEQFLLFPQCFLLNQKNISPFVNILDIISLFAVELEAPKIGISSKGLTLNSIPNDKFLDPSSLKDFADDILNAT